MITLRQLQYFGALAEYRHFGRAAAVCAVSQPALSMQVRELEKQLGAELVERRPGDVLLTDLGAEVARRGERILAGARDLCDFVQRRKLLSGALTFGVIPTLAPYVLPRLLPKLQLQYPELRLELRETQTKNLLEELARGLLDVVMLALPVTDAEVETVRLFNDPFLLAVPAEDPRAGTTRITPGDIDQQRLILLEEGHCLRDQALSYCDQAQPARTMSLAATSLATVLQMVASGYGSTLVPQVAAEVEARDASVKLLRFVDPEPGRTIGLAWRHTSPRKADFRALGDLIIQTRETAPRPHSVRRLKQRV